MEVSSSNSLPEQHVLPVEMWDPCRLEYQSMLNYGFADRYLPSALAIGGPAAEGEYISDRLVPCRFNRNGRCYKGDRCIYYHPTSAENEDKTPQALRISKFHQKDLHPRAKLVDPQSDEDLYFEGLVQHAESPEDFYIVPGANFGRCVCGCGGKPLFEENLAVQNQGFEPLEFINEQMSKFMDAKKRQFQLPNYEAGQIVVVKQNSLDEHGMLDYIWCRGIVEKSVAYDNDKLLNESVVDVQLIDVGRRVTVPRFNTAALPRKFSAIPVLAFRCRLANLHPIGPKFSSESIERFRSLVENKKVTVVFKPGVESYTLRDDSVCEEFRTVYPVGLVVEDRGKFIQVAEAMAKGGRGLLVHPLGIRPWLLSGTKISHSAARLIAAPADEQQEKEALKSIMDRERLRLYQKVVRKDGYFVKPSERRLSSSYPIHIRVPPHSVFNDEDISPWWTYAGQGVLYSLPPSVAKIPEISRKKANVAEAESLSTGIKSLSLENDNSTRKAHPPPESMCPSLETDCLTDEENSDSGYFQKNDVYYVRAEEDSDMACACFGSS